MTSGRSVTLRISRMAELVSCLARSENAHTGSKGLSMEGLLDERTGKKKEQTLSHNADAAPHGRAAPPKTDGSIVAGTCTFPCYTPPPFPTHTKTHPTTNT